MNHFDVSNETKLKMAMSGFRMKRNGAVRETLHFNFKKQKIEIIKRNDNNKFIKRTICTEHTHTEMYQTKHRVKKRCRYLKTSK